MRRRQFIATRPNGAFTALTSARYAAALERAEEFRRLLGSGRGEKRRDRVCGAHE